MFYGCRLSERTKKRLWFNAQNALQTYNKNSGCANASSKYIHLHVSLPHHNFLTTIHDSAYPVHLSSALRPLLCCTLCTSAVHCHRGQQHANFFHHQHSGFSGQCTHTNNTCTPLQYL